MKFFVLVLGCIVGTAMLASTACPGISPLPWDIGGATLELESTGEIVADQTLQGSPVLRVTGNGRDNNYGAWLRNIKVKPTQYYALSIFTRATASFPDGRGYAMFLLFFRDASGQSVGDTYYVKFDKTNDWTRTLDKVLIPKGTYHVDIGIRIDATPPGEAFFCSRVSLQEYREDPYAGVPLIGFEGVSLDTFNAADVRLGPGAALRTTTVNTGEAHSGEGYLEIEGNNDSNQVGLDIGNIQVKPNTRYTLSFAYKMTENFRPTAFIVMVYPFPGKPWQDQWIGEQSYIYPAPTEVSKAWKEFKVDIDAPPGASSMVIRFRLEHILPGSKLYLDDIALQKGRPSVILKWETDPKTAVLSGSVEPSYDIKDSVRDYQVLILRNGRALKILDLVPGNLSFSLPLQGFADNAPYFITTVANLKDGTQVHQKLSQVVSGHHKLTANLTDGTQLPLEVTDKDNLFYTFVKSRPWEGNRIGILGPKDPPPSPWTPPRYDAKSGSIKTWNNTILPGKGLCSPSIAFSKSGKQMTSQPVSILMNGKPVTQTIKFSSNRASLVSPAKITLGSSGIGSGMRVDTQVSVEFDGFTRYTLTIRPNKSGAFTVENLSLLFRFPEDYIKYLYAENGLVMGQSYSSKAFNPIYWFGNFDTGLCFCVERLHPGTKEQEKDWITLRPETDGNTLTVNLVNKPIEVRGKPLVVEFALLPTPARPTESGLRNTRFRSEGDATLDVVGTMPTTALNYFGYPEYSSKKAFDEYLATRGVTKADTLYYFGVDYAMETIPQMTYFKKDWINVPTTKYTTDHPAYHDFSTGDYTTVRWTPSWTDLCLYKFREFLRQTGLKGAYWDTAYPLVTEESGECYCPVFAGREFHKRVYVLIHQMYGDHAFTIAHQGRDTALPYAAFSNFTLNGEHLREELMEHTYYLEFASMPEMRATMAPPLGPAHMFLSQYWQADKSSNRALMAQTAALAMIHDASMWVAGQEVLMQMMRQKYNFGDLRNAQWYPYWEMNPFLQADNPKVRFSFYERNGDLFVIPMNTTREKQMVTFTLSQAYRARYPDVEHIKVYDPVADQESTQPLVSAGLSLDLEPYCTRLITIRR